MNPCSRIAPFAVFALAAALGVAGCKNSQDASADQSTQNMAQDPANANLAPASDTTSSAAPAQSAPATTSAPASNASYESTPEDTGEQPVASAPQPPPALPEYSQPQCPGDGYIWTPGYWNYEQTGYYWVPGVWTRAPYTGALWTPPYWGWHNGVYALFPGHWGLHIGFYGGVDYGYGYTGYGYHGGYWDHDRFNYNRTVNNVNTTVIRNVYTYNIVNKTNITRISYNGGRGGIAARPRPEELVTVREPRAPIMTTQVRHEETARANRAQFEPVNHGRPAAPVVERPLEADRDVHPMARPVVRMEERPVARPEARPAPRPEGRPAARPDERRAPGHPEDKIK